MTAQILDGESLAASLKADLADRVAQLAERGVTPGLGTVLVGDDGPSANYVAMKRREAPEIGIASHHEHLPADATASDVAAVIDRFNADPAVDAYLLQYPFPPGLEYGRLLRRVDPAKHCDDLHPINLGHLVMGVDGPLPCTPAGIQALLVHHDVPIEGRHVVIIGRGLTIGRPLANLLALKRPHANAAVTVLHTGVADLAEHTRRADILVAAAGSPGLVTAEMVKPGAAVVKAGVSFVDGKLRSDVAPEVDEVAGWVSPASGGVGPMTRAMLLRNTVEAAERSVGKG
ncbi:bifunctional methylenetetrahydrofolate dehydrogenase/methenyltetrahydrofolate cyclohydrolase [soil metagenome]